MIFETFFSLTPPWVGPTCLLVALTWYNLRGSLTWLHNLRKKAPWKTSVEVLLKWRFLAHILVVHTPKTKYILYNWEKSQVYIYIYVHCLVGSSEAFKSLTWKCSVAFWEYFQLLKMYKLCSQLWNELMEIPYCTGRYYTVMACTVPSL